MGDYLNPNTWKQEAHTIPNPMEWQHADVAKRYAEEANDDAVYVENLMKQIDDNFDYVNEQINEVNEKLTGAEEVVDRITSIEQQCMEDAASASAKAIEASQSASLAGVSADAAANSASTAISNAVSAQQSASSAATKANESKGYAEQAKTYVGLNGLVTVNENGVMNIQDNTLSEQTVNELWLNGKLFLSEPEFHSQQITGDDFLDCIATANAHIYDWSCQVFGGAAHINLNIIAAYSPQQNTTTFNELYNLVQIKIPYYSKIAQTIHLHKYMYPSDPMAYLTEDGVDPVRVRIELTRNGIYIKYLNSIQSNAEYQLSFTMPIGKRLEV